MKKLKYAMKFWKDDAIYSFIVYMCSITLAIKNNVSALHEWAMKKRNEAGEASDLSWYDYNKQLNKD